MRFNSYRAHNFLLCNQRSFHFFFKYVTANSILGLKINVTNARICLLMLETNDQIEIQLEKGFLLVYKTNVNKRWWEPCLHDKAS